MKFNRYDAAVALWLLLIIETDLTTDSVININQTIF